MNSFGTYTLSYSPAEGTQDPEITISVPGESSLPEMLSVFKSFLMAAGYSISFNEEIVVEKSDSYYGAAAEFPNYFSTPEDLINLS